MRDRGVTRLCLIVVRAVRGVARFGGVSTVEVERLVDAPDLIVSGKKTTIATNIAAEYMAINHCVALQSHVCVNIPPITGPKDAPDSGPI